MISVENFDKLIHQGRSFEDYFRYVDAQAEEAPVTASPGLTDDEGPDSLENSENSADSESPESSEISESPESPGPTITE